ncbi:hypothetical protein DV737_g4426, partial [Chaetothyriales sp. CBS 132003]
MLRILESQAPARQTATDTIATLSGRLSSATLLEDRALRDLIAGLRTYGEDLDTIKLVLETLLMLFEPDENSPEASDEITLWLADEFAQKQDNITADEEGEDGVSDWIKPQRDMNVWGLLTVVQLFLAVGAQGTSINQNAFWHSGLLSKILELAFHDSFSINIHAKALETCGAIICGNASLQERFGDLNVQLPAPDSASTTNGHTTPKPGEKAPGQKPDQMVHQVNVIEALLELTMESAPLSVFDARLAACNCVKAFIEGHNGIRVHVLKRAIEGHKSGNDVIPNILTVLLEPPSSRGVSDPYQQWFAAVLLLHLLYDNPETKAIALQVVEGDAANGEEVVTLVQSIASNVLAGVQHPQNERALLGFLMLLSIWVFEDPDAVNDFLGEGSNVNGLITTLKVSSTSMPLVAGLCTLLLGIVYEFSTKDSPLPRSALHSLLTANLGRETYVDRLTKLRSNVAVRDFEVIPQGSSSEGLPEVYFDKTFIDFLKDNYSRLLRAIDRDPKFEVSVMSNGVQKGVSRDLVDGLRAQVEEQKSSLEAAQNELVGLRRKLEDEELEHRRTRESTTVELGRIKLVNQSLQANHEEEMQKVRQQHFREREALQRSHAEEVNKRRADHATAMDAAQRQREQERVTAENKIKLLGRDSAQAQKALQEQHRSVVEDMEKKSLQARQRDEAEIKDLKTQIESLTKELAKTQKEHLQNLHTAHEEYASKRAALEAQLKQAEEISELSTAESQALREKVKDEQEKRKAAQMELDDLLVVFGDVEAKRDAYKAKLKELDFWIKT